MHTSTLPSCHFKAPVGLTPRLPFRPRRATLCCNAAVSRTETTTPPQRTSMIRSLAAAVELTGQVQRYETFAGRSAMVGVAVAAGIEIITDHGIFFPVSSDTALVYGGVALATLAASVAVALTRSRSNAVDMTSGSMDILESVYASLTAVQRSAASVTQAQVDKAVDYLLETVLDSRFDNFSIDALLTASEDEDDIRPTSP